MTIKLYIRDHRIERDKCLVDDKQNFEHETNKKEHQATLVDQPPVIETLALSDDIRFIESIKTRKRYLQYWFSEIMHGIIKFMYAGRLTIFSDFLNYLFIQKENLKLISFGNYVTMNASDCFYKIETTEE